MVLCHTLNFRIRMPKAGTSTYNAASRLRGSSTTAPVSKSQALTLHNGIKGMCRQENARKFIF